MLTLHSAPCRNRTYNLVSSVSRPASEKVAFSGGQPAGILRFPAPHQSISADQDATKMQPAHGTRPRLLRDRMALPCAAVRRGWLLPDDGPDGGRAA